MFNSSFLVVACLASGTAVAAPNFKDFAGKQGCAAIPYDNLRKECEEDQKAVDAACKKPIACDSGDVMPVVNTIKKDRAKVPDLDKQRVSAVGRKSAEMNKPDNSPAVNRVQGDIDKIDDKIRQNQKDEDEQIDKLGKMLDDHETNGRDCLRARSELAAVFTETESKAAQEAPELLDDEEKVFDAWDKGGSDAAPKLEVVEKLATCIADRRDHESLIAGTTKPNDECDVAALIPNPLLDAKYELNKAQAWCRYRDNPNNTKMPHDRWSTNYDQLAKNRHNGSEFERLATERLQFTKNWAIMDVTKGKASSCVDKLSSDSDRFIPDGVVGNSDPRGSLEWGKAYNFIEVKGWTDMSFTGNLKKMINYVEACGGKLTVVFRSGDDNKVETRVTPEMAKQLNNLGVDQKPGNPGPGSALVIWLP